MMLRVDSSAALPVYEQIREQVTRMALSGVLAEGARLPTIRQLAADLGIAKGTVARAYEMLESSAVVESRGSRGTFVTERAASAAPDALALSAAAEAYVVAVRQAGFDLTDATEAMADSWATLMPES